MLLACDLGNSFAKFALYDKDSLAQLIKCTYSDFNLGLFEQFNIDHIAVSSVVPDETQRIAPLLSDKFKAEAFIITHSSLFNLKINYLTQETLGIDRICSAEGAFALYKKDTAFLDYNDKTFIVTVDSGTATTINVVGYYAMFTGGIILPGLSTMAKSLNKDTARLPEIDFVSDYKDFLGRDTRSSIASGIIHSTTGLVETSCQYLKKSLNAETIKLFLTGGNARHIKKHLTTESTLIEDLVLRGVKSVFERNIVD